MPVKKKVEREGWVSSQSRHNYDWLVGVNIR